MFVQSSTPPSLEDAGIRRLLSAPAFQAFVDTAGYLGLEADEILRLLSMPAATYDHYVRQGVDDLNRDTLERMSLVLGVTKNLRQILTDDEGVRRWLRAGNSEPVFAGRSPMDVMQDSIADLQRVRAYIDGWQGGP